MASLTARFGPGLGGAILLLVGLWLIGMVLAPNLMMLDFSLRPNLMPNQIGTEADRYTLANFIALFSDSVHRAIFFKTVWASALVTLTTLIVTYPLAFWLAKIATPRGMALALVALIIPFWINEVLRTLAWYILLAFNGPLNAVLLGLGIISEPMRWFGDFGVLAGMVYAYILFMLFPIYNSISTLETAQIEAARNLGASTVSASTAASSCRMPRPASRRAASSPSCWRRASYVAPALLGSPGSRWFTEIIYNWFFEGGNWNRGAAYALVLLVLCMLVVLVALRVFRVNLADVAK
jgi:spermidine/putrescine transport system permease protein